jgi:hypothetical protein
MHPARKQKRINSPTTMIDTRPNSLSSFLFRRDWKSSASELPRKIRDLNYFPGPRKHVRLFHTIHRPPALVRHDPDYCFKNHLFTDFCAVQKQYSVPLYSALGFPVSAFVLRNS